MQHLVSSAQSSFGGAVDELLGLEPVADDAPGMNVNLDDLLTAMLTHPEQPLAFTTVPVWPVRTALPDEAVYCTRHRHAGCVCPREEV